MSSANPQPKTLEEALIVLTAISEAVDDCERYCEDETVIAIEGILCEAGLRPPEQAG